MSRRTAIVAGVLTLLVVLLVGATSIAVLSFNPPTSTPRGNTPLLPPSAVVAPVPDVPDAEIPAGTLEIKVTYLPLGTPASIAIAGPDGFRAAVTGDRVLTGLANGTYTVSSETVSVDGIRTAPVHEVLQVKVNKAHGAFVQIEYANRIAENFVEVSPDDVVAATFDDTRGIKAVTLTGSPLQPGNVFALGITDATPQGAAGFVTSVFENSDGTTTYVTEQATLQDLIPQGKIQVAADPATFTDNDASVPSGSGGPIRGMSASVRTDSLKDAIGAAWSDCDRDGKVSIVDPTDPLVTVTATLDMEWGWTWDYADTGESGRVDAHVTVTATSKLGVSISGSVTCKAPDRIIAQRLLGTIAFAIGPVPVVVVPVATLSVSVGIEAEGKAAAEVGFEVSAAAWAGASGHLTLSSAGVEGYAGASGPEWTYIPPRLTAQASATVHAGLTGKTTFLIYGLAGPFGSATLGPNVIVEADTVAGGGTETAALAGKVLADLDITVGIEDAFCGTFEIKNAIPQSICEKVKDFNKSWTPVSHVLWEGQTQWIGEPGDPCQDVAQCEEQPRVFFTNDITEDRIGVVPPPASCRVDPWDAGPANCQLTVRVASGLFGVRTFAVTQIGYAIGYEEPANVFNDGSQRKQLVIGNEIGAHGHVRTIVDFKEDAFQTVATPQEGVPVWQPSPDGGNGVAGWDTFGGAEYGNAIYAQVPGDSRITTCGYFTLDADSSSDLQFRQLEVSLTTFGVVDGIWRQEDSQRKTSYGWEAPPLCFGGWFLPPMTTVTVELQGCDTTSGCTVSLANWTVRGSGGGPGFTTGLELGSGTTKGEALTFHVPTDRTKNLSISVGGGRLLDRLDKEARGNGGPGLDVGFAASFTSDGNYCWVGTTEPSATIKVDASVEAPNRSADEGAAVLTPYGQDVPLCTEDGQNGYQSQR